MMAIFQHQDCDGDAVEILADNDDPQEDLAVLFSNRTGVRAGGVRVDRDAALRLHAALGEWLYPVHTPEAPNRSLIEQMIDKAVGDLVAAVLPLHLSTVGRVCTRDESCEVADPEPHDVGHPEPAPPLHLATEAECGADRKSPCIAARHLSEPDHGRLMSELPRRVPRCTTCGHGWGDHMAGMCWSDGSDCPCTRNRPGTAKPECTCPTGSRIRRFSYDHQATCPRNAPGAL